MQSSIATVSGAAPPESQRMALINLLADDDPAVYHTVRDKILSCGESACDWLRPHSLSSDHLLRRRTQEIIRHFDRQLADNRFLSFCLKQGEDCDLEEGALLLAQTQYPDINTEAYSALLDNFAIELGQRIDAHGLASQTLNTVVGYVYGELGFSGNDKDYYDPENNFLNRVLDRRTGNPINLCIVYLLLARRLSLPMAGISFPGNFLCRYQTTSDEIYIDAFHRGKIVTKTDCIQHLVRGNYDLHDHYLAPVSARRILARSCSNLHQIYSRLGHKEETTRFQRYLVALSR